MYLELVSTSVFQRKMSGILLLRAMPQYIQKGEFWIIRAVSDGWKRKKWRKMTFLLSSTLLTEGAACAGAQGAVSQHGCPPPAEEEDGPRAAGL